MEKCTFHKEEDGSWREAQKYNATTLSFATRRKKSNASDCMNKKKQIIMVVLIEQEVKAYN